MILEQTTQYRDGWHAHKICLPVESNPYDDQTQAASRAAWSAGWYARFDMRKHGTSDILESADDAITTAENEKELARIWYATYFLTNKE